MGENMSVNKAIIVGNLGSDPDLKHLDSGSVLCNLSVATSRKWTSKDGERHDETQWHRVVVWGKQGESCAEYLGKGRQVYVEGRIETREYEKEGEKRYSTEIVAERVVFLSSKANDNHVGGMPF